jgi:3-oxoacyl-[acyl-carrier protein] reductase
MLTSIAGKSVVVTGATKGIGKGIARVFARNGAKVTIVARHRAEAKAAAEETEWRHLASKVTAWPSVIPSHC